MPDNTVPRDKVRQFAANINALMELKDKQSATQAELIRWCLSALRQTTDDAKRRLEAERVRDAKSGKRYHPVGFTEPTKKVNEDRKLAFLYLEWLATKLEDQSVRLPNSNQPKE